MFYIILLHYCRLI